jgi:hypothetical protein
MDALIKYLVRGKVTPSSIQSNIHLPVTQGTLPPGFNWPTTMEAFFETVVKFPPTHLIISQRSRDGTTDFELTKMASYSQKRKFFF